MRTLTVEASQPDAEKACLMTADQGATRKGDIDSLFASVVAQSELPDGQFYRLKGNPADLWPRVVAFVEEEKICCPFFNFEARELEDGVEMTIRVGRWPTSPPISDLDPDATARHREDGTMPTDRLSVIRAGERDTSGVQTSGMIRAAGVAGSTCGAKGLWMGYVTFEPGMESGAHHHGNNESGIYIVSGRARFRFGEGLDESFDVGPGDFIFVPPHVVHMEGNLSDGEPVVAIVARNSQEGIVVNV